MKRHLVLTDRRSPKKRTKLYDNGPEAEEVSGPSDRDASNRRNEEELSGRRRVYEGLNAMHQSRVHNGDVFIQGNYYAAQASGSLGLLMRNQRNETLVPVEQRQKLRAQLEQILHLFLALVIQSLAQLLQQPPSVPGQIQDYLVPFEDAFGRRSKIDTTFIASWAAFEYNLQETFRRRPGHRGLQRVKNGMYRLHTIWDTDFVTIVDPEDRPGFHEVFVSGRRVKMSIVFRQNELTDAFANFCIACYTYRQYMQEEQRWYTVPVQEISTES